MKANLTIGEILTNNNIIRIILIDNSDINTFQMKNFYVPPNGKYDLMPSMNSMNKNAVKFKN